MGNKNIGRNNKMDDKLEDKFPSVNLAYEFVKPSYDWLQNRFDAVNSRIEFLLTFTSSITLATPIFVGTLFPTVDFVSLWFMLAMGVFILTSIAGIWGRMYGGMKLVNVKKLYDEWLEDSEWEFKRDSIYFAGKHFDYNHKQVNTKANFGLTMTILFVIEIIFLLVWIATLK